MSAIPYSTAIPPGRADLARLRFRLPEAPKNAASMNLEARVFYRRFNQEYTNYVNSRQHVQLELPIVMMAEAKTQITAVGPSTSPSANSPEQQARRWNDYGIALLEQSQYGPAAEAFRLASALNPSDPDPLISAAIAELRTERFGPERAQLHKASVLLDEALKLNPTLPRARFYKALVLRAEGNGKDAAAELGRLASEFPRDRLVQRELGSTLYALGQLADARAAFEAVVGIDPTDANAYQYLAPLYTSEGR